MTATMAHCARLRSCTVAALLLAVSCVAWSQQAAPFVLAVHPYLPSEEIIRRFTPLADYLGQRLGRPVRVRVGRDYEDHLSAIGGDRVDIAYMGPAPYTQLVARYGRRPLLVRIETLGKPYLSGVIFARQDGPVHELKDLAGKRFAFGDPASTMGSQLPQYLLLKSGIGLGQLAHYDHVLSHNNVIMGVLAGDFDAGAVRRDVFDEAAHRGLRVVAELPQVSEHLFVTRSDLPEPDIQVLREALLTLKSSPEGPGVMHAMGAEVTGMVPVADADYDSLRGILRTLSGSR